VGNHGDKPVVEQACCRTGLLWVGFVCRSIKNFDKAALNGTLGTLSNRLIRLLIAKQGVPWRAVKKPCDAAWAGQRFVTGHAAN